VATDNLEFGKAGEDAAAEFLAAKGYEILERNWRQGSNELDLVAVDGKELVIVEVKARASLNHGEPWLAVNRQKQKFLVRAANTYVISKNIDMDVRFDIVSVLTTREGNRIEHIVNAFYPTL
jgi:putative endonuclease